MYLPTMYKNSSERGGEKASLSSVLVQHLYGGQRAGAGGGADVTGPVKTPGYMLKPQNTAGWSLKPSSSGSISGKTTTKEYCARAGHTRQAAMSSMLRPEPRRPAVRPPPQHRAARGGPLAGDSAIAAPVPSSLGMLTLR